MKGVPVPLVVLLLQWTLLLGVAWALHAVFRRRDPRWRLMLWRVVLVAGFLLPLRVLVPAGIMTVSPPAAFQAPTPAPREGSAEPAITTSRATSLPTTGGLAARGTRRAVRQSGRSVPWPTLAGAVWVLGSVLGVGRLVFARLRLERLTRRAQPATSQVTARAARIEAAYRFKTPLVIRISPEIGAPFVWGVFKPTLLIPSRLAATISEPELDALLNHEVAHRYHRDLAWFTGWQLMRAFCWFHPLLWHAPSAHELAAEEEADRLAAQRLGPKAPYAAQLARLALRVCAPDAAVGVLGLSATSQVVRRLRQLGRPPAVWRKSYAVVALAVAVGAAVTTAGWYFGPANTPATPLKPPANPLPWTETAVVVRTTDGAPIKNAAIRIVGLNSGNQHTRWPSDGSSPSVVYTDSSGAAVVRYPRCFPNNGLPTDSVGVLARGDGYVASYTTIEVRPSAELRLVAGIPIQVRGVFGPNRETVRDLQAELFGETERTAWTREPDGVLSFSGMSAGKHVLLLSGRSSDGEQVFSEPLVFFGNQRERHSMTIELKPGARIRGSLDSKTPRPVRNGRANLMVYTDQVGGLPLSGLLLTPERIRGTIIWERTVPIAADGTFAFESVPHGMVSIRASGDGFVAKAVRISSPIDGDTLAEVSTEISATLRVQLTKEGKTVPGVRLYVHSGFNAQTRVADSGPDGVAVFRDLPPRDTKVEVADARFDLATGSDATASRTWTVDLPAGRSTEIAIPLRDRSAPMITTMAERITR